MSFWESLLERFTMLTAFFFQNMLGWSRERSLKFSRGYFKGVKFLVQIISGIVTFWIIMYFYDLYGFEKMVLVLLFGCVFLLGRLVSKLC